MSVWPNHGNVMGGTNVTVVGVGFDIASANTSVVCLFGGKQGTHSAGLIVSGSHILCTAPAHAAGVVTLDISMNGGLDFTDSGVEFTYHVPVRIDSFSPRFGPESGGTVVHIYGSPPNRNY